MDYDVSDEIWTDFLRGEDEAVSMTKEKLKTRQNVNKKIMKIQMKNPAHEDLLQTLSTEQI